MQPFDLSRITAGLSQASDRLSEENWREERKKDELNRATLDAAKHLSEMKSDVKEISSGLQKERDERTKDDKKYFWLGAIVSLVVSFIVQYLPEFLKALRLLFQQKHP